jgi:TP901 family phage tail tape measure protein
MDENPQILSYMLELHDKATLGFKAFSREATFAVERVRRGMQGLRDDASALSRIKPPAIVQAEQILAMEKYRKELAAVKLETAALERPTEVQVAKMAILNHQIRESQLAYAAAGAGVKSHKSHIDTLAAGAAGLGLAFVVGSTKAALSFGSLTREVGQQSGLQGRDLKDLMGIVREVGNEAPHAYDEIAGAAVALRQRFHFTNEEIAKSGHLFIDFAERANQQVGPAVVSLNNVMRQFHIPASGAVDVMDQLVNLAQKTQKPLADTVSSIERFGPQFRNLGLHFKETLGLFAAFQQAGVNPDNMGRGLSHATGFAQKQIDEAAKSAADGGMKLRELRDAVDSAQQHLVNLQTTVPRSTEQQTKLNGQIALAKDHLTIAEQKLKAYADQQKSTADAGKTVVEILQKQITGIEGAKTKQDALNIADSVFGNRVGPTMVAALYKQKKGLDEHVKALGDAHDATHRLGEIEKDTLGGQLKIAENRFSDLAITIGQDFTPAVKAGAHEVGVLLGDIDDFVKHHKTLSEILIGGAAGAGSLTLLSRHSPLGSLLKHLPGPAGKVLGRVEQPGTISGVRGTTGAGTALNPIAVTVEGGTGPGGLPIPGKGKGGTVAGEAEAAAGGRAGAGAAARLKGALGGAGERAGKSIGRGFVAYMATQGLGAIVGGKTGHEISHTGGGIATGATIGGALAGPFGAGLGGFLGAMSGGTGPQNDRINQLRDLAKHSGTAADQLTTLNKVIAEYQRRLASGGPGTSSLETILAREKQKAKELEQELGANFAVAMAKSLEDGGKATDQLVAQMLDSLSKLPPGARKQAADMTIGIASMMQEKGDLPKGTVGKLRNAITSQFKGMSVDSVDAAQHLTAAVGGSFQDLAAVIYAALADVGDNVTSISQALGMKPIKLGLKKGGTAAAAAAKSAQIIARGATGMRVPGAVGPDTVPIYDPAGGVRGIVAPGELLVANRHTEHRVNRMLALHGTTLGAEVAGESRRHDAPGYAKGGRFNATAYGPPWGGIQGGGTTATGIDLHGAPHKLIVAVDPSVIPLHSRLSIWPNPFSTHKPFAAEDTGGAIKGNRIDFYDWRGRSAQLGWGYRQVLVEMLGGGGIASLAGVGGGGGGRRVTAPGITGPAGALKAIAQRVARLAARDANHYLDSLNAGTGDTGGVGGFASAAPSGIKGLGMFDGRLVADWIIPELKYARAHGWRGHITSGYRSPTQVVNSPVKAAQGHSEHQGTQWPHGAVDFGGPYDPAGLANKLAFVAATAGYKGHKLLPAQGFRDDGHMSGTGHALGGRIPFAGAFGHGGMVTASSPTMAVFGDNGTETALFVPHAAMKRFASGGSVPGYHGHTRVGSTGLLETWHDPPGRYFTDAAWQTYQDTHHKASAHHQTRDILAGGGIVGELLDTKSGNINLGKAIGSRLIDRVVTAVLKGLREGSDAYDEKTIARLFKQQGNTKQLQTLRRKAIEQYASRVLSEIEKSQQTAQRGLTNMGLTDQLAGRDPSSPTYLLHQANAQQGTLATSQANRQRVATLLKDAKKARDTKLIAQLKDELAQLDDAILQAKVDSQSAKAQAVQALTETLQQGAQRNLANVALRDQLAGVDQNSPRYFLDQARAQRGVLAADMEARGAIEGQLREAIKERDKTLAAGLRKQLDAINDAILQAQVDEQAAVQQAIQAVKQGFEDQASLAGTWLQIHQAQQHIAGTDTAGLQALKDKQGGFLTPAQIAQAQQGLAQFITDTRAQQNAYWQEYNYDETLPQTSANQAAEAQLILQINQLEATIKDQVDATTQLTTATEDNTKAVQQFGGTITYTFQGQQYLVGQSSESTVNVGVGI